MKINSIQHQNSISHKAYFKPSADLECLCKMTKKNDTLMKTIDTFKHSLPNQELELKKIPTQHSSWHKIINKDAGKAIFTVVLMNNEGLQTLLDDIILRREAIFSKNKADNTKFDLYKELLTSGKIPH